MKSNLKAALIGILLWTGVAKGQDAKDTSPADSEAKEPAVRDNRFWSREKLTGDWGGKRESLASAGLTVDFNATYVLQGVAAGGFQGQLFRRLSREGDIGNTFAGDLQAELDTAKAGWWQGGTIRTRVQARTGRSAVERAGSIAAVNNEAMFPNVLDRFDRSAFALTELTYEHALGEKISVFGGLLNTAEGDDNAIAGSALSHGRFLNFGLLYSLVEDATTPNTALGGGISFQPTEKISGSFSVFGSAETAGENPFDRWHGTTFATEWTFAHTLAEHGGAQTLGFLYGINGRRTDITASPRFLFRSLLLGHPIPTTEANTWAFYYNAHQFIHGDDTGGWGVFTRFGVSDGNPNVVKWNAAGGVGGIGLLPGRKKDGWGLGVFYLNMSDEDLLRGLGVSNEVGGEAFYNIAVSPWMHVSLDAQVIDSGLPRVDTTWVLGLRVHFDF